MTTTLFELAGADPACLFSPYAWRVRMSLRHKGLAFEGIPWRFTEKDIIAPSGGATVPVIIDQGRWVRDSLAIAEYLEETYPDTQSLFGPPAGLGLARFISAWTDRSVNPPLARVILTDIFSVLDDRDRDYFRTSREKRFGRTLEQVVAEGAEAALVEFQAALEPARRVVARQAFLGGDTPGYADYALHASFMWARMVSAKTLLAHSDPVLGWLARVDALHGGDAAQALAAGGPGTEG